MIGIAQFKRDPAYLLKNNLTRIAVLSVAIVTITALFSNFDRTTVLYVLPVILVSAASIIPTFVGLCLGILIDVTLHGFNSSEFIFTGLAIAITFPVSALYHCAAHQSIRPLWLNRITGELCGLLHTSNLDEWSIIHAYHHRYADDLEMDPHCPRGLTFVEFARTTGKAIGQSFAKHFFLAHGQTERTAKILRQTSYMILARQLLLTIFWFLILGPKLFVYFFAANIVFKKIHYAWFNWATHVDSDQGMQVINQNSGLYLIINRISFNLYYHKNHHLRPALLNPGNASVAQPSQKRDSAA